MLLDPKSLAPSPLFVTKEPIREQHENSIDAGLNSESLRSSARRDYFLLMQRGRDTAAFQSASVIPSEMKLHSRLAVSQPVPQPPTLRSNQEEVLPKALSAKPDPQGIPKANSGESAYDDEVFRPIQQVRVDIAPGKGDLPQNRAAMRFARAGEQVQPTGYSRMEPETQFAWDAPALCHRPLFFEDVNLERHGYHVKYIQPFLSAAHFFSRVPAMPYLATSERSRVCNYTLGHYQPGSSAPYVWYYPHPSLTGTAIEGAVVTGLILAIP
jgi:hypothetical protein